MRAVEEFLVARPSADQVVEIGLKTAQQKFGFVFVGQRIGGRKGEREPGLVEFTAGVFLELRGERRHYVERGVHGGKFLEHANHAPVVLERVQARPGKNVAARGRIAVLRLVHVPKQHEMDSRHACEAPNRPAAGVLEWRFSAIAAGVALAGVAGAGILGVDVFGIGTMRIIDRYIFREVLSHALLGLGVFTFVIFVPQLVQIMNVVARHSGDAHQIALLFLSAFPRVLTFSVPIGVLVGVLIGLGRMSADSELIAMNAAGMGLKRILIPVGVLAALATAITLCMTVWLGPISIRTLRALEERLRSTQVSFEVQPRIFNEQFPHLVLYVQDISAAAMNWHRVFLAESDGGDISRLTLAEDAIVVADRDQGKLQLYLHSGSVHESQTQGPEHYGLSVFGERDLALAVGGAGATQAPGLIDAERPLRQLLAESGAKARESMVEFHRRFAFPGACLVFALVALPVGARPRRGGRAAGFILAVSLVCAYYIVFVFCASLARDGSVPIWLGIWTANILMAIAGIALLPSVERLGGETWLSEAVTNLAHWWRQPKSKEKHEPAIRRTDFTTAFESAPRRRFVGGFPQVLDYYLLRNFLFYFVLLLVGFILLFEIFTFFDLLDDIGQHRATWMQVAELFSISQLLLALSTGAAGRSGFHPDHAGRDDQE